MTPRSFPAPLASVRTPKPLSCASPSQPAFLSPPCPVPCSFVFCLPRTPGSSSESCSRHCHMVSVPEAPIHEYARPVLSHNDVWLPWQPWMVQPIAVAMTPQPSAHNHFRLCVLAVNGCHVGRAPSLLLLVRAHSGIVLLSLNRSLSVALWRSLDFFHST